MTTPTLPPVRGAPTVNVNGESTMVSIRAPAVPVRVGTTSTIGGISVGVPSGGSSPGATLDLP